MDAMIMRRYLIQLLMLTCFISFGQQMNWTRLTEDTLYYGKDYLPDHRMINLTGPAQTWDFRTLKAPYALSRRIIQSGDRDGQLIANLLNGKQTDAILQLSGKTSQVIQLLEDNLICTGTKLTYTLTPFYKPFFNGVLGETYTYRGKMVSAFEWPRNISCVWSPPQLPDSCRITYTLVEETVVDAEGTLYLPTEIEQVYRQKIEIKRAPKIEIKTGTRWTDITALVPGIRLIKNTSLLRYVSSATGLQLVEIELNEYREPVQIEFRTHPLVTRVFAEEPVKPDIFAYPNPSYDVVRFQLTDLANGLYKLKIFNILGVSVKEQDIQVDHRRETVAVDLREMQRGTYLYRLQDKAGRTIRTKRITLIQS